MSRLSKFLDAKARGGIGWVPRYEQELGGNPAWLSGHYQGILDDLIEILGHGRVRRIVEEFDALDDAKKTEGRK